MPKGHAVAGAWPSGWPAETGFQRASRATLYMVRRSRYGGFVGVVFDGRAGAVFWALSLAGEIWAFFWARIVGVFLGAL